MAQLILVFKNKVLKTYTVAPEGEVTIGRHPSNTIVVDNLAVSGKHAKIRQDKDGLFLIDLGSTNGTFVNNEKISKCRLVHQDWVSVGSHILIVDMYETLSLEATMEMLLAATFGGREADQTIMFDMSKGQAPARLVFLAGGQGEYELINNLVTIGKNRDADIVIGGFWSFLAGQPAARIERRGNRYVVSRGNGYVKTKLNGEVVRQKALLNHQDIIKIGSLKMQVEFT